MQTQDQADQTPNPREIYYQTQAGTILKYVVSERIEKKREEDLTTEKKLDKKLRDHGTWNLQAWWAERAGLRNGEG